MASTCSLNNIHAHLHASTASVTASPTTQNTFFKLGHAPASSHVCAGTCQILGRKQPPKYCLCSNCFIFRAMAAIDGRQHLKWRDKLHMLLEERENFAGKGFWLHFAALSHPAAVSVKVAILNFAGQRPENPPSQDLPSSMDQSTLERSWHENSQNPTPWPDSMCNKEDTQHDWGGQLPEWQLFKLCIQSSKSCPQEGAAAEQG